MLAKIERKNIKPKGKTEKDEFEKEQNEKEMQMLSFINKTIIDRII